MIDKHQCQHLLHSAHRHPRPHARGRGAGEEGQPQEPALAGSVGRTDQSRGLALYHRVVGERPLPDRRHLVADRNRRILITPLPGATHSSPARPRGDFFGVQPVMVEGRGKTLEGASRAISACRSWPGQMRSVYGDHQRFIIDNLLPDLPRHVFHRRRRPPRRGTATTGSLAASTM